MVGTPGGPEVLLVFPGRFKAPDPQVPLQLLHVAGALRQAGYRVRIVDVRLQDYRSVDLGDPVFVGVTCMSGPQIRYGLEFARRVRAERPRCPIVWGGVHPTLLPEQTAASDLVDVVVRGESELVVGPLADALASGEPLDAVKGLTYRTDGTVRSTPDADLIDLDAIPVELPYDLLELDRYPTLQAGRVHMQTSRGCPHRCGFCYNTTFNKRRWRGKSPDRVVDEMQHVVERFPQREDHRPRRRQLLRRPQARRGHLQSRSCSRGIKVSWRANCRFDYLAAYDQEFVSLMEEGRLHGAGLRRRERLGAHAGLRLQGRDGGRDRAVGGEPARVGAFDRSLRLVAQRSAGRDLRGHGEDVRPHGPDGAGEPSHPALRHLPLHAVPEPPAGVAAARSSGRRSHWRSGAPSRSSTSSRRGTAGATWSGCGRSRR